MKKGNVTFDGMDSNDSTFPHGQEGQEKFLKKTSSPFLTFAFYSVLLVSLSLLPKG